ncbi:MAG TPA: ParB/RepB/Spo0J family partition protein [Terracidiphilus sp.]|jgi:ParB family chromosome partitioning protein|nr:ParB/RepB/Spo0J family partition protein [Terracidiphilus sp.]
MTTATDTKRRALGKGLDSLLPRVQANAPAPQTPPPAPAESDGKAREIPLNLIDRNPFQTRGQIDGYQLGELAASIAANGVLQPILVRPQADGRFQLIAGERRWRASELANKTTVPALLKQVSDEQAMEITIVENLQREGLNPIEQARAFERLGREFHMTQEQMGARTGKDRVSIANFLRLLKLPVSVQAMVESKELSQGHAKALLGLPDGAAIEKAAQHVLQFSLSVRHTETYVQGLLFPEAKKKEPKAAPPVDPNVREVAEKLQRALGLKVKIEDNKGRGRVIIEYADIADFDGLLEKLAGE